jgi:hypothetical protein
MSQRKVSLRMGILEAVFPAVAKLSQPFSRLAREPSFLAVVPQPYNRP